MFFQFEIITNPLINFILIPMSRVRGPSIDVRIWRLYVSVYDDVERYNYKKITQPIYMI